MHKPATTDELVLDFGVVGRDQVATVGGKGAHLGELSRIDGVNVPPGFCVTTAAFRLFVAGSPAFEARLDRLARTDVGDQAGIRRLSAELRGALEATPVPDAVARAIADAVALAGADAAYAVRSSATAEDLPTQSFAGQQDSFLDVVGTASVLDHVVRCWASLFTERAVAYRARNGFDQRSPEMAVVVQRMVAADAAGTMFTADPLTGDRTVTTIEAGFGLGDAMVSGLVDAELYRVRKDELIDTGRASRSVLTNHQALRLARLGRLIEAHLASPQDIEWCLVGDRFEIVQSRPITTLYPVPQTGDADSHVFVSVGHQQMMTDAMKPLGLSMWQRIAMRPMFEAGGRLFVDIAAVLTTPGARETMVAGWKQADPLIGDALQTIVDRTDAIPAAAADVLTAGADTSAGSSAGDVAMPIATDPGIVAALIRQSEASIDAAHRAISGTSGTESIDGIVADIAELKRILFDPISNQAIMAGIDAATWLNHHLGTWLGGTNAADVLAQSAPGNVTSEMGLALLDVADVIRPRPHVVAFLRDHGSSHAARDAVTSAATDAATDGGGVGFLDAMAAVPGGAECSDAVRAYLDRYGMRCVGEIDITRPRWSERPAALIGLILGNIDHAEPGAGPRRFQQGLHESARARAEILERVRRLPDGERKAADTDRMIDRLRTFIGFREFPKYGIVRRLFVYKQALMAEARTMAANGVIDDEEDVFFLTLDELREAARSGLVDRELIACRRVEFVRNQALTPPRVMTSDGEIVTGRYRRDDLPPNALVGLAVSAGTIEGRARVVVDIAEAELEPGDILVTVFTDPSWSPLFVAVAGLVTEVGGLMTHGAVIAREYGLPAVVGVEGATRLIADGEWIRVNGTDGHVEILSSQ